VANNKIFAVEVRTDSFKGNQQNIVKKSIQEKKLAENEAVREDEDFFRFDQVWCVFDIDNAKPKIIQNAKNLANQNAINLAISNSCFEIWLLMHFEDVNAPLSAKEALRSLKKHIPRYDKEVRYDQLEENYKTAKSRARNSVRDRRNEGIPGGNPSTSVFQLTEALLKY